MLQPQVIVFVGTVGAGKSTHARLLCLKLKRKGLKTKVSSLKTGHLFAFILEIFLAKIIASKRKDAFPIRILVEERPNLFRRIFRLWLSLDLVSITIKFLASIYLPLKLGYVLLVEEFTPATISDYIYLSRIINFPLKMNSFVVNYLVRLINLCSPTQIIFLDAKNDELKIRWKLRGSFDEREDYLHMQRTLLLQISRKLSTIKLIYVNTGSKTLTESQEIIMSRLLV
jgi:hypothetical protein